MPEPFGTQESLRIAHDRAVLIRDEVAEVVRKLEACLEQTDQIDAAKAAELRSLLGGVNASLRNIADEAGALASRVQRVREGLRALTDRTQNPEHS